MSKDPTLIMLNAHKEVYPYLLCVLRDNPELLQGLDDYEEALACHFLKRSLEVISIATAWTIESIKENGGTEGAPYLKKGDTDNMKAIYSLAEDFFEPYDSSPEDMLRGIQDTNKALNTDKVFVKIMKDQLALYGVPEKSSRIMVAGVLTMVGRYAFNYYSQILRESRE